MKNDLRAMLHRTLASLFGSPLPECQLPVGTVLHGFGPGERFAGQVVVRLWYPARATAGNAAANSSLNPACSVGAETADGDFPLLVSFSGWSGSLEGNVILSRMLASSGFVVAAVGYPTGAGIPLRTTPMDFSSASRFAATVELAECRVRLQADAGSFVLDQLGRVGSAGPVRPIADHLRADAIGAFGFSFGGAVAAQLAWQDPRIRAVMNLDGWLFGDPATRHFEQPYLLVSDDTPLPNEADLSAVRATRRYRAQLTDRDARWQDMQLAYSGGYKLVVQGSRHADFSDGPLLNPVAAFVSRRAKRIRRTLTILHVYSLGFFGELLDQRPAAWLDQPERGTRYPEARCELFKRRGMPLGLAV